MAKKLKDWTLGEVQEECKRRGKGGCYSNCPLVKMCNGIANDGLLYPSHWNLADIPILTPDEIGVCRLLKAGGVILIKCGEEVVVFMRGDGVLSWDRDDVKVLLPSLRPGDTLDLTTMDL